MHKLVAILAAVFLLGCESIQGDVHDVSLAAVLSNPRPLLGQVVSVSGFLIDAGGVTRLYLTEEHSRMVDDASSIAIGGGGVVLAIRESCDGVHAMVRGVLTHEGMLHIFPVDRIVAFPGSGSAPSLCWSRDEGAA